jgi:hypothetical protein
LISAVASFVWPGTAIDRKRFVEAWVRFADPSTVKVSVPLLRLALRADGRANEAQTLEGMRHQMFGPGYDARVLTGEDVDADEAELRRACPTIDSEMLRAHSYPVLFYEQVRSKLVHEYELDGSATAHPMTMRKAGVSYANRMVSLPGVALDKVHHDRRIHFEIGWLIELARTIARSADLALAAGAVQRPKAWWLDDLPSKEVAKVLALIVKFLKGTTSGATAEEVRTALKLGKQVRDRALREGVEMKMLTQRKTYTVT